VGTELHLRWIWEFVREDSSSRERDKYNARVLPHAYANLLYLALLRRTPDASGLAYWTGVLPNPGNLTAVINAFLNSQEYIQRY
jgi:hypothetical protein